MRRALLAAVLLLAAAPAWATCTSNGGACSQGSTCCSGYCDVTSSLTCLPVPTKNVFSGPIRFANSAGGSTNNDILFSGITGSSFGMRFISDAEVSGRWLDFWNGTKRLYSFFGTYTGSGNQTGLEFDATSGGGKTIIAVDPSMTATNAYWLPAADVDGTSVVVGSVLTIGSYSAGTDVTGLTWSSGVGGAGAVFGSGTNNKMPKWTGTSPTHTLTDSDLNDDGTDVHNAVNFDIDNGKHIRWQNSFNDSAGKIRNVGSSSHSTLLVGDSAGLAMQDADSTISADQTAYDPGDVTWVRASPTSTDRVVRGIARGTAGRVLFVQNINSASTDPKIVFSHQDTSGTSAGDRIITTTAGKLNIFPGMTAVCVYQGGAVNRWRCSRFSDISAQAGSVSINVNDASGVAYDVLTFGNGVASTSNETTFGGDSLSPVSDENATLGTSTNRWLRAFVPTIVTENDPFVLDTDGTSGADIDRVTVTANADQAVMTLDSMDIQTTTGTKVTEYDGVTTAGKGVVPVHDYIAMPGLTNGLFPSAFAGCSEAGAYRISIYLASHKDGTPVTSAITADLLFTDSAGSSGTETTASLDLSTGNHVTATWFVTNDGHDIQYDVNYGSDGTYDFYASCEKIGD